MFALVAILALLPILALLAILAILAICYGLTVRMVEEAGTEYIRTVNHILRTIVIALISQYPRCQPSLYDYASRPYTLRS